MNNDDLSIIGAFHKVSEELAQHKAETISNALRNEPTIVTLMTTEGLPLAEYRMEQLPADCNAVCSFRLASDTAILSATPIDILPNNPGPYVITMPQGDDKIEELRRNLSTPQGGVITTVPGDTIYDPDKYFKRLPDPDVVELCNSIIDWWKDAQYKTTGYGGEHNVFDDEPDFVTKAKKLLDIE